MGGSGKARFATTHWTLVLTAAAGPSAAADRALADLCESYWYPLYAYLRRRGNPADDAQDLTQAFFARLLEKRALRQANPARGRFRSFLLASLNNFAINERQRHAAHKRGGFSSILSLDFETAEGRFQREPASDDTPEHVFDRTWALTLLERGLARAKDEFATAGKTRHFERFEPYLMGDQAQPSYAETGAALGMSEGAVKVAIHRLRRRFRDLLREEIAQTVSSPDEIEDELRHLRRTMAR